MSHASIAERPPAASLRGVAVDRSGRTILTVPTWDVRRGQRWVVLGANGCGKTTLLRLLSLYEHPSRGSIEVLGETLTSMDLAPALMEVDCLGEVPHVRLRVSGCFWMPRSTSRL